MPRLLLLFALMSLLPLQASEYLVYFGTYTNNGRSKGIYSSVLVLAPGRATLGEPVLAAETRNPSFLAYDGKRRLLVASGDLPRADGTVEGCVRVFSDVRGRKGLMTLLGDSRTGAQGAPCHVSLSPDGSTVLAAHYNEGFVSSIRLSKDGLPSAPVSRSVHQGVTGPNAKRQDRAHAHSLSVSPDGRFAFACDLGLDRVFRYALDSQSSRLGSAAELAYESTPGFGPRHSKFSQDGRHFYVLNELAGTVDAFRYDAGPGGLSHLQTLSSLPDGYSGENTSAEIQIHPSGRFLYASNRGPDTIAVYARDPDSGLLTLLQHVASGGRHPRHFALSPDGAALICANRDTDNVVLFGIDAEKGTLTNTGQSITVPSAVCVLFVP